MATHADNLHYGVSIVDSTIDIATINNVDGINPDSILDVLPTSHDLSNQCDGQTKQFTLNPTVKVGTENLFTVFLDGVRLARASANGDDDFFLFENNSNFNLGPGLLAPPQGSTLIAIYTEESVL